MAWSIEGRYFENCTCEAPCPCTVSLALGADYDRCQVVLVFHVDKGEVDGTDVSGLTVTAVADAPQMMLEGNWRLGVVIDAAASDEQAEKLGAVFSGGMGGPMEALAPLIGEQLGVERAAMTFSSEGVNHSLDIEGIGHVELENIVPFGVESGEPARLVGIFHPAGSDVALGKAGDTKVKAFGLEPELVGKSGFSTEFAWSG
jgi:hypothetical protein